MKKIAAVIPARYDSSRFPGKPLAVILGKTMIRRVYERVKEVESFTDIIVATDDERIKKEVESFQGHVIMTGECACGTERVYEAAQKLEADLIINVQGDEPFIRKEMIWDLIRVFDDPDVYMGTLKKKITLTDEINSLNVVKVVTDKNDDALYFSRCPVPYHREIGYADYFKHIGIYGYTKSFLHQYIAMGQSELERTEKLEQLRVLEHGYKIRVKETKYDSFGIDIPEQIEEIEEKVRKESV